MTHDLTNEYCWRSRWFGFRWRFRLFFLMMLLWLFAIILFNNLLASEFSDHQNDVIIFCWTLLVFSIFIILRISLKQRFRRLSRRRYRSYPAMWRTRRCMSGYSCSAPDPAARSFRDYREDQACPESASNPMRDGSRLLGPDWCNSCQNRKNEEEWK